MKRFFKKQAADASVETPQRKLPTRRIVAAALVLCIAGGAAAHFMRAPDAEALAGTFEEAAQRRTIIRQLTGTGTLTPINQYNVTSLATGKVLTSTIEEGDRVEQGQLLYRIDATETRKNIEQAKLTLRQSELTYDQQRDGLRDLTVKSNWNGVISEVAVKVGESIQPGAKLFSLRDSAVMLLTVPFNSSDATKFSVGQSASVTIDGSFEMLNGTVREIDATDTVGGGMQVTRGVTIAVNNPGALSPTAIGTAKIAGIASNGSAHFAYRAEKTITAQAAGQVSELTVKKGSLVKTGDVVARLSSKALQNQSENSALSVESARLTLQNAEKALQNSEVRAPISGTVVTRNTKAGDSIGSASGVTTLAVIYDMSALTFTLQLDELDVNAVKVGQHVDIRVAALSGRTFAGKITKISVAGTTNKGTTTYPVTVQVENPPAELLPGMNVNATIVVSKSENTISVPVSAVHAGNTVYVRTQDKDTAKQPSADGVPAGYHAVSVKTGISDRKYIEIISGLSDGDKVYVKPEANAPLVPAGGGSGEGSMLG